MHSNGTALLPHDIHCCFRQLYVDLLPLGLPTVGILTRTTNIHLLASFLPCLYAKVHPCCGLHQSAVQPFKTAYIRLLIHHFMFIHSHLYRGAIVNNILDNQTFFFITGK